MLHFTSDEGINQFAKVEKRLEGGVLVGKKCKIIILLKKKVFFGGNIVKTHKKMRRLNWQLRWDLYIV